MESILNPWPWYTSGILITSVMFLLILMGKSFGVSSNLRTICTICGAGKKHAFFNFDWKQQKWNLLFLLGTVIGGFIASHYLSNTTTVMLNPKTVDALAALNINSADQAYLPTELFNTYSLKSISLLITGGFLVGFGARYAGGCTSGHAISGLSNLQLPSLIAVIGFFTGGLIMIHLIFPFIF